MSTLGDDPTVSTCLICGTHTLDPEEAERIEHTEVCRVHRAEELGSRVAAALEAAAEVVNLAEYFSSVPPEHRASVSVLRILLELASD